MADFAPHAPRVTDVETGESSGEASAFGMDAGVGHVDLESHTIAKDEARKYGDADAELLLRTDAEVRAERCLLVGRSRRCVQCVHLGGT